MVRSVAAAAVNTWHGFLEYADPTDVRPTTDDKDKPLSRMFAGARYPLEQRIENKKRGIGRQRYPFVGEFSFAICQRVLLKRVMRQPTP